MSGWETRWCGGQDVTAAALSKKTVKDWKEALCARQRRISSAWSTWGEGVGRCRWREKDGDEPTHTSIGRNAPKSAKWGLWVGLEMVLMIDSSSPALRWEINHWSAIAYQEERWGVSSWDTPTRESTGSTYREEDSNHVPLSVVISFK